MRKIGLFLLLGITNCFAQNLNVMLMESTGKIVGPSHVAGQGSVGTGFVLFKPSQKNPQVGYYVLVTADHVLTNIQGETATLVLRRHTGDENWERIELPLGIRRGAKPLWVKHPEVDIAAVPVRLPPNVIRHPVSTGALMPDELIRRWDINPGDELLCLGYPFGLESNPQGFPVLRSGKISSYPLLPTKTTKTFLFDFSVFGGNSGGPVYFYATARTFGNNAQFGNPMGGIIGVVTEGSQPMAIGRVIHASFIRELLDLLPEPAAEITKPKP